MKKQRSKAELINALRTHAALKKNEANLSGKTVFWRMGVEWCYALREIEKFSTPELVKFFQYMSAIDFDNLTEKDREELREYLHKKEPEWTLKTPTVRQCNNEIDQDLAYLEHYNTEKSVDYSLLACKYLIEKKGYASKRLTRVIASVYYMDHAEAEKVWNARQEIFDKTGLWISLTEDDDPTEPDMVI